MGVAGIDKRSRNVLFSVKKITLGWVPNNMLGWIPYNTLGWIPKNNLGYISLDCFRLDCIILFSVRLL